MSPPVLTKLAFMGAVKPGATVQARWSASHPMDSGFRVDDSGRRIPRNIIHSVSVFLNEQLILEADLGTAMTSPVYLAFSLVVLTQSQSTPWRVVLHQPLVIKLSTAELLYMQTQF